jgi:hypothetical protein
VVLISDCGVCDTSLSLAVLIGAFYGAEFVFAVKCLASIHKADPDGIRSLVSPFPALTPPSSLCLHPCARAGGEAWEWQAKGLVAFVGVGSLWRWLLQTPWL